MKATGQYFPVVLFAMPYKVVLVSKLVMKSLSVPTQTKATGQYFTVALLINRAADDGSRC